MDYLTDSESKSAPSLLSNGDALEQQTWEELRDYVGLYETIWRIFSAPLRCKGSIQFRDGIDADLEILAMCNYTAYLNVARALKKIKAMEEDLKFSEEIWANLQRAVEVGKKAAGAFEKVYQSCTGKKDKLNRAQLNNAEEDLKKYRNRLHHPVRATIKEAKIRLIPRRDRFDHYYRWTEVMYHAKQDDFVSVEGQLRSDLAMSCQALQSLWAQMRDRGVDLLALRSFQTKVDAGVHNPLQGASQVNPEGASGTIFRAFCPQSIPDGKQ
jgi:hypothetical protein